jgi:PAS domain S-box-containing protein
VTASTAQPRPPRLVLRFALYSALALLLAGAGIFWFVRHEARVNAEKELAKDASRAAASLGGRLEPSDLSTPVRDRERLQALDALFAPEKADGVVRVKLWRPDGTVTYSTDHTLIGARAHADELERALNGETVSETGRLNEEGGTGENIKVLSAYVPLKLRGHEKPSAVLEFYNDYGPIEDRVSDTVKPMALALVLALLLLFTSLFPILRQVTKALEQRNRRLEQQAAELEKTLTERRQAVAGLREAEHRYRTLVEQLPLVTYIDRLDAWSSAVFMSPQIEEILGHPVASWLDDPQFYPKVLHPDDRERVLAEHADAYSTGQPFTTQYRMIAADGRVVWFEDVVTIVRDEQGAPLQAQGFLIDITHRKATELALSESEERFRTLVANVPGVIFRCAIDADWTMEFLSDEIDELVGYPASDFIANRVRSFASIVHPDDTEDLEREVADAVREERPYTTEYRVIHRDGDVRKVVERGQAIVGRDGEYKLDGAIFDVTDRRQAEDERLKLAAIVESSGDAIMAADLNGNLTSWNSGAEKLFGYTAEEVLGTPITMLAPPDRAGEPRKFFEQVLAGEAITGVDTVRRRKDGTLIDVSFTYSPLRDATGAVVGASAIAQDIGERRKAAAERERLVEELAEQNERLRELDRLKDEFVALVSHELRTPLTSIRGYLELVLEGEAGDLTDEQRQFLGVVERNAHRLLALVGDLLFLAQVEAGKLSLEIGAVDLSSIAADAVEAGRPLAEEKGVTLTLASGPLPLLAGDRGRLAQLLDNLVSNGLKFTPSGGRVDVRVRGEQGTAVVEVRDTGMGIPVGEQQHLFERFFRTSKATEQAIPGTGLGLAISKAIVEAHGGEISVTSEDGAGSTFRVALPIRQAQPAPPEAEPVAL